MDLVAQYREHPLPFAQLLGIEILEATPDRVVGQMMIRPEFCTRPAIAHGGVLMTFADTLGALATVANLPEGGRTTTVESKTNFIAPAPVGTLIRGETTNLHRGRRTMLWQTRVTDSAGALLVLVAQTQLVL